MVQEHHPLTRLAVAVAATAALLAGCHAPLRPPPSDSLPIPQSPGSPPSPPSPAQRTPPPPRENHLSPATRALVTQAQTLASHGDLDGASSTLDRALRIEPNNPLLWIERGNLRLTEGDARQAENCGRKALSLASGDHATQVLAGRLLADALRAQQRNQEAHEVETQPFMH
jgi:tetratricopeptide (TPR) repeat protein